MFPQEHNSVDILRSDKGSMIMVKACMWRDMVVVLYFVYYMNRSLGLNLNLVYAHAVTNVYL